MQYSTAPRVVLTKKRVERVYEKHALVRRGGSLTLIRLFSICTGKGGSLAVIRVFVFVFVFCICTVRGRSLTIMSAFVFSIRTLPGVSVYHRLLFV